MLRGHFFLRKKGHFLKIRTALLYLLQKSWGHVLSVPPPPIPTSVPMLMNLCWFVGWFVKLTEGSNFVGTLMNFLDV